MHEACSGKPILLCVGDSAPIAEQERLEYSTPVYAWHVPLDLPSNMIPDRDHDGSQVFPVSVQHRSVGRIAHIHRATDASAGKIGGVIKSAWVALARGQPEIPS
jgi:hypothetical protein